MRHAPCTSSRKSEFLEAPFRIKGVRLELLKFQGTAGYVTRMSGGVGGRAVRLLPIPIGRLVPLGKLVNLGGLLSFHHESYRSPSYAAK